MKRNEKIELLNSIKNGTPIPIALKIIVLLFETIDNPNIYYDINCKVVNIDYYKKSYTNISIILVKNISSLIDICENMKKLNS